MDAITEKTKVPLFAVLTSVPILVGFIVWISVLYSNVSANTQDIEDLKSDKKEMVRELKEINKSLTEIKTTLKIKEQ